MILAGDFIPKQKNVRLELPFSGIILSNLESPIMGDEELTPLPKAGPNLKSRSLGVEQTNFIFNLANNHMMDYGVKGLHLTQNVLCEKGISFVGAGDDVHSARRPIIVEEAGRKIGIIGCCERQFGCAEVGRPGCAEKGLWLFKAVRELKAECDYVVVSCHVAFEHSPLPSPKVREFYKLLIDAGADVIHGHHAHVPQGWEAYGDGVIFYGMGNFVVDPDSWHEKNQLWSIVADVDFSGMKLRWRTMPVGVGLANGVISVAKLEEERLAYADNYLEYWNSVLGDTRKYMGHWQTVCVGLYDRLYGILLKTPCYVDTKKLSLRNRIRYLYDGIMLLGGGVLGWPMSTSRTKRDAFALLNFSQCESHQEVIATALGVFTGSLSDKRAEKSLAALSLYGIV